MATATTLEPWERQQWRAWLREQPRTPADGVAWWSEPFRHGDEREGHSGVSTGWRPGRNDREHPRLPEPPLDDSLAQIEADILAGNLADFVVWDSVAMASVTTWTGPPPSPPKPARTLRTLRTRQTRARKPARPQRPPRQRGRGRR